MSLWCVRFIWYFGQCIMHECAQDEGSYTQCVVYVYTNDDAIERLRCIIQQYPTHMPRSWYTSEIITITYEDARTSGVKGDNFLHDMKTRPVIIVLRQGLNGFVSLSYRHVKHDIITGRIHVVFTKYAKVMFKSVKM